ncbi:hypothetical protein CEXT_331461 [Caerostris extrusa]|uniref:Secreted protein n=1 Tax=Caerostris extrusa TaxID=172846 RepID=A0AAV4NQL5_CAEEX|nr:hypothetical protein CEXT_331461 [Caerostris extrusa]
MQKRCSFAVQHLESLFTASILARCQKCVAKKENIVSADPPSFASSSACEKKKKRNKDTFCAFVAGLLFRDSNQTNSKFV